MEKYFEDIEKKLEKHLGVNISFVFEDRDSSGKQTNRYSFTKDNKEFRADIFDLNYVSIFSLDETIDYDIYL